MVEIFLRKRTQTLLAAAALTPIGTEQQIVHHRLIGEQPAALWYQDDAARNDAMRRLSG